MRHLYLYVEGQTEQTFTSTVLASHLAQFQVWLMGSVLAEQGRSKGKVHRGGITRYEPFKRGLQNLLQQHSRQKDVTISTMVDLYAFPSELPGWDEAEKLRIDPLKRVERLEEALAADIEPNRARFIPYFQLHEYEALLFSDPSKFDLYYADQQSTIAQLQHIANDHQTPEHINDGDETAPSKRIIKLLPDYEKVVVGSQVAQSIGLAAIRAKCPHFDSWVKSLEQLGQSQSSDEPAQ